MKNTKNFSLMESTYQNLSLGLKIDWLNKLCHHMDVPFGDLISCTEKIFDYQNDKGLPASGIIDAQTRLSLIEEFTDLAIQIIGPNTASRLIIDTTQTESGQYHRLTEILSDHNHLVLSERDCIQIVAIRGLKREQNGWYQTNSADQFTKSPYGTRDHFSSAKQDYDDTLICLVWREDNIPHIQYFQGISNPCSIWPSGTSHLCTGQYGYKMGRHRTREPDHIKAVLEFQTFWPQDWLYDVTPDSVQYIALESTSPIEVIRSHDNSLDISDDDIQTAEIAIAERRPNYTNENYIKINIHTCAVDHASSLGCQNIKPVDYYDFIQTLLRVTEKTKSQHGFPLNILYSLMDASFLK